MKITKYSIENLSDAINITSSEKNGKENKFLEGIVQFGKTDVKQIMKSVLIQIGVLELVKLVFVFLISHRHPKLFLLIKPDMENDLS